MTSTDGPAPKRKAKPPKALLENLMMARLGWGRLVNRSRIHVSLREVLVLEAVRRAPQGLFAGPALLEGLRVLFLRSPQEHENYRYLGLLPWREADTKEALASLDRQKLIRCFQVPSGRLVVRIADKALEEFAKPPVSSVRSPRPGEVPQAFRLNIERSSPPSSDE
jgi:hypothetical protein